MTVDLEDAYVRVTAAKQKLAALAELGQRYIDSDPLQIIGAADPNPGTVVCTIRLTSSPD